MILEWFKSLRYLIKKKSFKFGFRDFVRGRKLVRRFFMKFVLNMV